jgi:hypothetical protein
MAGVEHILNNAGLNLGALNTVLHATTVSSLRCIELDLKAIRISQHDGGPAIVLHKTGVCYAGLGQLLARPQDIKTSATIKENRRRPRLSPGSASTTVTPL